MHLTRRSWLAALPALLASTSRAAAGERGAAAPLRINAIKVTPIALPDPPILAAGGCHGPYFLRNVVQVETDAGIVGIGETKGGEDNTRDLERARELIVGESAFAYRSFAGKLIELSPACYAAIELACLDACGKATGRRLCELLGGPIHEEVEFAA